MFASVKRGKLRAALAIPERYEILLVVAIGRPAETVVLDDAVWGNLHRSFNGVPIPAIIDSLIPVGDPLVIGILGREVAVLADRVLPSGETVLDFPVDRRLPSGIYFVRAETASSSLLAAKRAAKEGDSSILVTECSFCAGRPGSLKPIITQSFIYVAMRWCFGDGVVSTAPAFRVTAGQRPLRRMK